MNNNINNNKNNNSTIIQDNMLKSLSKILSEQNTDFKSDFMAGNLIIIFSLEFCLACKNLFNIIKRKNIKELIEKKNIKIYTIKLDKIVDNKISSSLISFLNLKFAPSLLLIKNNKLLNIIREGNKSEQEIILLVNNNY